MHQVLIAHNQVLIQINHFGIFYSLGRFEWWVIVWESIV